MCWLMFNDANDPLSNFCFDVLSVVNVYNVGDEAEPVPYVKLRMVFEDGTYSKEFIEPIAELDDAKWFEKDIRCRLHPKTATVKVQRYLADAIRSALPTTPSERRYLIDRIGVNDIDDEKVFFTGGGVIRPPSNKDNRPIVEFKPVPYSLDIDPNITENESFVEMLKLIDLSPNAGRIILTHTLLYIMRDVYKNAWKSPCFCVFLYGKTGIKKTTISAFMTQIYNRNKGIVSPQRLRASVAAAVGIIKESRDCVVVLDDLFPAESNQIRSQQEETLIEITRFIADGTLPARMRGKKVDKETPTCGVLFTGEYIIGKGSDAARLLPVELSPSPDSEKLKQFQDNPLIVSTFYFYFIQWFISNYREIQDLLKEWLDVYRKVKLGVHDRLRETHYFLNTAYVMFIQYCFDKDFISEQEAQVLHRSFLKLLTGLIQAQDERVKQGNINEPDKADFLDRIRALYKEGELRLAENAKLFSASHDGLVHNDCLCIRGKNFRDKICKCFLLNNFEDVLNVLEAQGALKRVKNDKRTIQIYGTGGKRFYAIPLDKLR